MKKVNEFGIPKKKEFGGNLYILHNAYRTKVDAEHAVEILRSGGRFRARIYKSMHLAFPYSVYYRPVANWKAPMRKYHGKSVHSKVKRK